MIYKIVSIYLTTFHDGILIKLIIIDCIYVEALFIVHDKIPEIYIND